MILEKKEELIELTCMVCKKDFQGEKPQMCCSGHMCGCKGLPIEPVVCSEKCYDKIMNNT